MGALRAPGRPGRFLITRDLALNKASILTGDAEIKICDNKIWNPSLVPLLKKEERGWV